MMGVERETTRYGADVSLSQSPDPIPQWIPRQVESGEEEGLVRTRAGHSVAGSGMLGRSPLGGSAGTELPRHQPGSGKRLSLSRAGIRYNKTPREDEVKLHAPRTPHVPLVFPRLSPVLRMR